MNTRRKGHWPDGSPIIPTGDFTAAGPEIDRFLPPVVGPTLKRSMREAWGERANAEAAFLSAAASAPALFKPEAVEKAYADYLKAGSEFRRWSA